MTIGERIKKLRTSKDMTQQALADLVGVNQKYISAIELDSRKPSYELAKRMAKLFNVETDSLLSKESDLVMKEVEAQNSFTMLLLHRLVDEGIIKDSDISQDELEMIISAIRVDIKRIQKEKSSN